MDINERRRKMSDRWMIHNYGDKQIIKMLLWINSAERAIFYDMNGVIFLDGQVVLCL